MRTSRLTLTKRIRRWAMSRWAIRTLVPSARCFVDGEKSLHRQLPRGRGPSAACSRCGVSRGRLNPARGRLKTSCLKANVPRPRDLAGRRFRSDKVRRLDPGRRTVIDLLSGHRRLAALLRARSRCQAGTSLITAIDRCRPIRHPHGHEPGPSPVRCRSRWPAHRPRWLRGSTERLTARPCIASIER
jgi:hypothetical protein